MINKIHLILLATLLIWYTSCTNGANKALHSRDELLFKSDSLISTYPNDTDLVLAIVEAKIDFANNKNEVSIYKEVLQLDPNNPIAHYHILMNEGFVFHNKDYKNGQWDAIQSFSKAATYIDTIGAPYYWIGQAYEKKDEKDFELPLEAYNKSLELFLTDSMRGKVVLSKERLLKRKKTYEDFWK